MTPRPGDRREDAHGPIVCMAVASGYVMARRPGCTPFVLSLTDWHAVTPETALRRTPPVRKPKGAKDP